MTVHSTHRSSSVGLWLVAVVGAGTVITAALSDEVVTTAAVGALLWVIASGALVVQLLRD